MKSKFKYFVAIWAAIVVFFNLFVFILHNRFYDGFTESFWIGYIVIMLMFVAHLGVTWYGVKDDNLTKLFYNIPIIRVSQISVVVTFIAGFLCMAVPILPEWLGILICALAVVFAVVATMRAQIASTIVEDIDKKIKNKTFFIRSLVDDIQTMMEISDSADIKAELKKVYDTAYFSDAMSADVLESVESQITIKISELREVVEAGSIDDVKKTAKEAIVLINDRNRKCKLAK